MGLCIFQFETLYGPVVCFFFSIPYYSSGKALSITKFMYFIKIVISYVAATQAFSHLIFKNPLLTRLITKIVINH